MHNVISLFCIVDDFCNIFEPEWNKHLLEANMKKRTKPSNLTIS